MAVLGALGMVSGGLGMAYCALFLVFAIAVGTGIELSIFNFLLAFLGVFLAMYLVASAAVAGVGWALWRGRAWGWWGAMAIAGLWLVAAAGSLSRAASSGGTLPPSETAPAFPFVGAALAIGTLVYLAQPDVRAFFRARADVEHATAAAQAASGAHSGAHRSGNERRSGSRGMTILAAAFVLPALLVLAALPSQSLWSDADGGTLRVDAGFGLVFAALAVIGGGIAVAYAERRSPSLLLAPLGTALGLGTLLAALLVSAAYGAATASVVNGNATGDDGAFVTYKLVGFALWGALAWAAWKAEDLPVASARWGGAVLLGIGIAMAALSIYLFTGAEALQTTAEARAKRSTPGFELVAVVLALALAAWHGRRGRRRGH